MANDAASGDQLAGTLADRLKAVRDRIADACERARRSAGEVALVAVTKNAPPEQVRELIALGAADLGENRVPQLAQRAAQLNEFHARKVSAGDKHVAPALRWHFVGRLQRNKVKPLLPHCAVVHSVDSLRLAEEIDAAAAKLGRPMPVLLQVNASQEPQKGGVAVGAATHLGEQVATMPNVRLVGLMSMAAVDANELQQRHTFARTREVFEEMRGYKIGGDAFRHLSMGMTGDFPAAIAEGSTMVRVGSALFGGSPQQEAGADDE